MSDTYKLNRYGGVIRNGNVSIPADPGNPDWITYQEWLADDNTPTEADPAPLAYSDGRRLAEGRVQTLNATPTEIFRAPVPRNTGYKALLTVWGITADLTGFRMIEATAVVGRAGNGAVVIQTRVSPANATIKADHALGAGGSWPMPTIAAVGNDIVIRVTGAIGTTINWLLTGSFESVTPGGQP